MTELAKFVDDCELAAKCPNRVKSVSAVVENAISKPDILADEFRSSAEESLIHRSDSLVIVCVKLSTNVHFPPHNHNMPVVVGNWCGEELNRFYEKRDSEIVFTNEVRVAAGETISIPTSAIHSVVNTGSVRSAAIHVYLGDLVACSRSIWNPHTGQEIPYSDAAYFDLAEPYDYEEPFEKPAVCAAHS